MDSLNKDLFINPNDFSEIWGDVPSDLLRQFSENNDADILDTPEACFRESSISSDTSTTYAVLDEYRNDLQIIEEEESKVSTNPSELNSSNFLLSTDFKGIANFSFSIPINRKIKNSWEYSKILNQVFIDMNKYLIVEFHFDPTKFKGELFIRATPVYCNADYVNEPITRCTIHWIEDDPYKRAHEGNTCFCTAYNLAGHVIRSPLPSAMHSFDSNNRRHSVILPVDRLSKMPNSKEYNSLYFFACKTSCHKGMQRRPINVVFTLETISGTILGRCSLAVKICSCPKRDMERLENFGPRGAITNNKNKNKAIDEKNEYKDNLKSSLKQLNKLLSNCRKVTRQMEETLLNS